MQFKKVGQRIQVLRYSGYDREKRHSIVRMIGSFPVSTGSIADLPDELSRELTDDEKNEVQKYIEKRKVADRKKRLRSSASGVSDTLRNAAQALNDGVFDGDETWAHDVWMQMRDMQKALKKAGFQRPKVSGKARQNS